MNVKDEESSMQTTVGIVGLGNAGSAMATALSGKMPLVGFDANPERRHAVAHLALEWVSSLAQLANRVGTVVLSLPKPEISKAVVTELVQGAKAPELIIETSTIRPRWRRSWAPSARQARCASSMPPLPTGWPVWRRGKLLFWSAVSRRMWLRRTRPLRGWPRPSCIWGRGGRHGR